MCCGRWDYVAFITFTLKSKNLSASVFRNTEKSDEIYIKYGRYFIFNEYRAGD